MVLLSFVPLDGCALPHELPVGLVGIDRTKESKALQTLRLKGMMKEHSIMLCVSHLYCIGSPEEGDVKQSVLEDFSSVARENIPNNFPSSKFVCVSTPITSTCSLWLNERNHNCCCLAGCETNNCDLVSSCFNIDCNSTSSLKICPVEVIRVSYGFWDEDP